MKRFFIAVCAVTLLFVLSGLASAEPTVSGPTGLLITPTADIATPESAWVGATYIDFSDSNVDDTMWSYTLTGGISENFELGIAGFFNTDSDDGFGINAKYALMLEKPEMPAVSLGFNYMDLGGNTEAQLYVVGTKYIQTDDMENTKSVGLHAGLAYTDAKWIADNFQFWVGADFNLAENLLGLAEYTSTYGANDTDAFAFGVRYFVNDKWSAEAGMVDGDIALGAAAIF